MNQRVQVIKNQFKLTGNLTAAQHTHCKLTAACFMGIFDLSFLQAILGILVEMHFAPASQVMDELTVIGFPLSDHFVYYHRLIIIFQF